MTTIAIYDQILAEIRSIEADGSLRDELNFVGRVEAADRIDALRSTSDDLNDWHPRAQALLDQFAAIDERIYQRLRAKISAGSLRGEALRQELARYVGKRNVDHGYDALDVFVNGVLRLDTVPHETRAREPEMVFYQPTPARVIAELLEMMPIAPSDVFYDLGSGLGQVCILVHLLTGARARGIEFEPAYCAYARESARRLNLSNVEFINGDARAQDYTNATIVFMYTPFTGAMLERVLRKIEREARRAIWVCAYGECVSQIASQAWLSLAAQRHEGADALAVFKRR